MTDDLGWAALSKILETGEYPFSDKLLLGCYRIAQEHQYDEEREAAMRKLRCLVEEYVMESLTAEGEDDADQ